MCCVELCKPTVRVQLCVYMCAVLRVRVFVSVCVYERDNAYTRLCMCTCVFIYVYTVFD